MFAAQRDGGDDVVESFWKHHADGDLAVVAAIGGVESPTAGVETDLALNLLAQVRGQMLGIYRAVDVGQLLRQTFS